VLLADPADIVTVIHPLGLQPSRLTAGRSVSRGFLGTDWTSPAEFHGCGRFVTDSWMIFCRGLQDAKREWGGGSCVVGADEASISCGGATVVMLY